MHVEFVFVTFSVDGNEEDDEMGLPTADCWFVQQSKPNEPSSIVIVAYDQFNAVHQQVV